MQRKISIKKVPAEGLKMKLMGIFMIKKGVFAQTHVTTH